MTIARERVRERQHQGQQRQHRRRRAEPPTTQSFTIEGPTATIANPGDGGTIDINVINGRNWIDVAFDEPTVRHRSVHRPSTSARSPTRRRSSRSAVPGSERSRSTRRSRRCSSARRRTQQQPDDADLPLLADRSGRPDLPGRAALAVRGHAHLPAEQLVLLPEPAAERRSRRRRPPRPTEPPHRVRSWSRSPTPTSGVHPGHHHRPGLVRYAIDPNSIDFTKLTSRRRQRLDHGLRPDASSHARPRDHRRVQRPGDRHRAGTGPTTRHIHRHADERQLGGVLRRARLRRAAGGTQPGTSGNASEHIHEPELPGAVLPRRRRTHRPRRSNSSTRPGRRSRGPRFQASSTSRPRAAALGSIAFASRLDPLWLGGTTFRYLLTGSFIPGPVTITIKDGSLTSDSARGPPASRT